MATSLFCSCSVQDGDKSAQTETFMPGTGKTVATTPSADNGRIRVVSYNVENLYDTEDDPATNDDDFTESGKYKWNKSRYKEKIENLSKAIMSTETEAPAIIGLCEVENKKVVEDLVASKRMSNSSYKILHKDSPDIRGIDVALIYRSDLLSVKQCSWLKVKLPSGGYSRDILYAKMKTQNNGQLHILVNHWPSMREGEQESNAKRDAAAKVAKNTADSILKKDANANIMMIGDFNTTPQSSSLTNVLYAKNTIDAIPQNMRLYNLMAQYDGNDDMGTHKYKGKWSVLDQIIVSGNALDKSSNLYTTPSSAKICQSDFLLYENKKGYKYPKRTFSGTQYERGYSDHLPVFVDLYMK